MNTKFSFTLLAVLIVLAVSLALTTSFTKAPKSADLSQPARPVMIPATGGNDTSDYYLRHFELKSDNDLSDYYQRHPELIPVAETARDIQAPRLWSGEVFLSNNDSPDVNISEQGLQCTSEASQPRRYSGCVE